MVLKLGMLGMWHTHADGIVRQVAAHAHEFALTGFYDPAPQVVAERRKRWAPLLPGFRVFDRPEQMEFISLHLTEAVVKGASQTGSDASRQAPQNPA